jgi:asparagine synthase (glutamine-hydrolysing)
MCGIAGYLGTRELERGAVQRCLALMRRRGPDQQEAKNWQLAGGRKLHLLFSRLSIIDLDARANQPLGHERRWIVFNGELYNYLERRDELAAQGAQFRTSSDTEVMVQAIARQGWSVLDRCEGMWAFALFDEAAGVLSLCRDRFGEKPLYLLRTEDGLYFGSEPKFIAELLGRPLRPNLNHLRRYLVNGYKALYKGAETFFEGLEELPAGHVLHVSAGGGERLERYWKPVLRVQDDMSYEEAVAGARERLLRSVELRLRADVPLAFCMSGGIDSNALIGIAKREFGYDVHGFTIVNTDARYEEQDMVDLAVRELGVRHTAIPVRSDRFLERLREQVRYHDAPVYTITYYAHWMLQESIAAHGYRISVSGTAADEIFTGYYDHHLAYLAEVRDEEALYQRSRHAWQEHIRPIVRNPHLQNPDLFVADPAFREHIFMDADGFARYLTAPWTEVFREERYAESVLRNRMLNEIFRETTPVILHEDDLNAMYYSVENRSPFLDRDLFEFCHSIPGRHLVRDGRAKAVLRDAARGYVPQELLDNRRKVGFNAPIFDFLDVRDPAVRREVLADSPVFEVIRREKIEKLLERPDLPNSESKFLFYFLAAKLFLEEFSPQRALA